MKNNQIGRIVRFCKARTWITQREALSLGIYRLASRISDMKRMGYWIETEYVHVLNADKETTSRIAKYRVVKTPDEVIHNVENV